MLNQQELVVWSRDVRIKTQRLVLRRFRPEDHEVALAHELNREMMNTILDPLPMDETLERVHRLWQPWSADDGTWLALCVDLHGGETVGMVALRVTVHANETFEIGYRVHPDHHRRGYAREAAAALLEVVFTDLGAHKAIALCIDDNVGSYRLMERLGMQREACLRQYSRLGGRWRNELVYGLLADDPRPAEAERL